MFDWNQIKTVFLDLDGTLLDLDIAGLKHGVRDKLQEIESFDDIL